MGEAKWLRSLPDQWLHLPWARHCSEPCVSTPLPQSASVLHCSYVPRISDGEPGHGGLGRPKFTQLAGSGGDSNSGVLLHHPPPCLSEEDIYRILKAHGPCKALTISQKLGRKTAKEVNPDLYAMRRKHLLDLDEKSSTWAIYQPGRSLPAAHTCMGGGG